MHWSSSIIKLLEYDRVALTFEQGALEAAADEALEREMGARGLRAVLEKCMTQIMYEIPSDPTVCKVTITADCVKNGAAPLVDTGSGAAGASLPAGRAALQEAAAENSPESSAS